MCVWGVACEGDATHYFLFLLFVAFPGSGPSVVEGLESTELHLAMGMCASIGPGPGFFV